MQQETKTIILKASSIELAEWHKETCPASNEIDNAFTRHRAMGRKLRSVEAVETDVPEAEPLEQLPESDM